MDTTFLTLLILLAAVSVFFYNQLVKSRNRCLAAWADVDVQLIRRHRLLPNLVRTVKGYADFEQQSLSLVTLARSYQAEVDVESANKIEKELSHGLVSIKALFEDHPELRASESYQKLKQELVSTEDAIQHSRRYFNGTVKAHNTLVEQFPGLIFARLFRFSTRQFFNHAVEKT